MRLRLNLLVHDLLLHNSFLSSEHFGDASVLLSVYTMCTYNCNSCIGKPLTNQINFESHSQIHLALAKDLTS